MTSTRHELERLLAETGWSIYRLAKETGVTHAALYNWRNGSDVKTATADRMRAAMVKELESRKGKRC